jgi:hypothetical protein
MGDSPWPFRLRGLREFLGGPFFVPTKERFQMLWSGGRATGALNFASRLRAAVPTRASPACAKGLSESKLLPEK